MFLCGPHFFPVCYYRLKKKFLLSVYAVYKEHVPRCLQQATIFTSHYLLSVISLITSAFAYLFVHLELIVSVAKQELKMRIKAKRGKHTSVQNILTSVKHDAVSPSLSGEILP